MRIYEELFIVDPTAEDEVIDALIAQVEGIITEAGGKIDKVDKWGKRRLAYRVKKQDEGFYVLIQFSADAKIVRELERRLRVHELVMKYLTVRIDEKLKWLEKKKKQREKRAKRKPPVTAPPPATPAGPAAAVPGKPKAEAKDEAKAEPKAEQKDEAKAEAKVEPKDEAKAEPKAEVESEE